MLEDLEARVDGSGSDGLDLLPSVRLQLAVFRVRRIKATKTEVLQPLPRVEVAVK